MRNILSAEIIKAGFGMVGITKHRKNFKLKDVEILAKKKKLGLWSDTKCNRHLGISGK